MCKRVSCPNDGKPTWWGCGGHIESCLAGIPPSDRCTCEHVPVEGRSGVYEVRKRGPGEGDGKGGNDGKAGVEVGYEA